MTLLQKLNFKAQPAVALVNLPAELAALAEAFAAETTVYTDLEVVETVPFVLAFATRQAEVDALAEQAAGKVSGDGIVWVAYPKGTSKRYRCEFNRDTGWQVLGQHGFEGVRQVAINDDWSALRFRRVEFIKTMKRSEKRAMTESGKAKTASVR